LVLGLRICGRGVEVIMRRRCFAWDICGSNAVPIWKGMGFAVCNRRKVAARRTGDWNFGVVVFDK
jgi:hypothetical protein